MTRKEKIEKHGIFQKCICLDKEISTKISCGYNFERLCSYKILMPLGY